MNVQSSWVKREEKPGNTQMAQTGASSVWGNKDSNCYGLRTYCVPGTRALCMHRQPYAPGDAGSSPLYRRALETSLLLGACGTWARGAWGLSLVHTNSRGPVWAVAAHG